MFGQIRPIIIDEENTVLCGNGLFETLKQMGEKEADCYRVIGLSDNQKKKLMLADNRVFWLGEDDAESIDAFIRELGDDLDIPGFDDESLSLYAEDIARDLDQALSEDTFSDPLCITKKRETLPAAKEYKEVRQYDVNEDEVPGVCKCGQLWKLGRHTMMCGDSTNVQDIKKLMGSDTAEMIFTDPPWNVAYGSSSNPFWRRRTILNDNLSEEEFAAFLNGWMQAAFPYLRGDLYCVLGASEWPTLDWLLRKNKMHWSGTIIWEKDQFVLGRSNYQRRYEPIWYGWPDGQKSSFCGRRDLDDVWNIPRPKRSEEHPTMKPVELVARAIENSSGENGIVLDPFGGSGTTLVAAEQLNRRCKMMELSEHYCDVIIRRWETMTGCKALLIG